MKVSFMGYNEQIATFEAALGLTAGVPVKISENGTVAACASGEVPCGVTVAVRGGLASVQLGGYINMTYTKNTGEGAINAKWGYSPLVANGTGGIKAATGGLNALVTDIDETNGKIGFII